MALNPNNNNPPIYTSHTKPRPNPQEAPAQMNGLLCIQNTWHPPPKIIIMEEPFDPWSILSYNHWLHLPTSKTHMKTDLFSTHQNFHDPQHMQSSTLSTHQLPIILYSAPIHPWPTHIPTPTKPPTVNLFDPYRRRLPTHGLPHWLKPWQQVGNGRAKKMDGRADWQRNNMLRICLRACSLICYLFSFKPSLLFTYMVVTCLVRKFTITIMFFISRSLCNIIKQLSQHH